MTPVSPSLVPLPVWWCVGDLVLLLKLLLCRCHRRDGDARLHDFLARLLYFTPFDHFLDYAHLSVLFCLGYNSR